MKKLVFLVFIFASLISFSQTYTGKVKVYIQSKGFGYIILEKSKIEVSVIEENLIDEIDNNDIVNFLLRDTRKGLEAYNVKVLRYKKKIGK